MCVYACRLAGLWGWLRLGDELRNWSDSRRRRQQQQRAIEPVWRPCHSSIKWDCTASCHTATRLISRIQHSSSRRQPHRSEDHASPRRDWHVEPGRPASALRHPLHTLRPLLWPHCWPMNCIHPPPPINHLRLATCLGNLEMSGNLTAVRKLIYCQGKVQKMSRENYPFCISFGAWRYISL